MGGTLGIENEEKIRFFRGKWSRFWVGLDSRILLCFQPGFYGYQRMFCLTDHSTVEVEFHVHGTPIVKRDVSMYDCQVNQK